MKRELNKNLGFGQWVALVFTMLIGANAHADANAEFLAAAEPFLHGDPETAVKQLEPLAESKNARAAVVMSRVYASTSSRSLNIRKACHFASIVFSLDDPDGAYEMAKCLLNKGFEPNSAEVIKYLQIALDGGSLDAKVYESCGYADLQPYGSTENKWELSATELKALDAFSKFDYAYFRAFACDKLNDVEEAKSILLEISEPWCSSSRSWRVILATGRRYKVLPPFL